MNSTTRRPFLPVLTLASALALGSVCAPAARAENDEPTGNEYRFTLFPYHRINDELTGFGYLGVWLRLIANCL